jgi:hypothetical protein
VAPVGQGELVDDRDHLDLDQLLRFAEFEHRDIG